MAAGVELLHERLPDCAIAHVLHYLSARPRLDTWWKHVPPATVLAMLRTEGSVACVAGSLFDRLKVNGVAGGADGGWDTDNPCNQTLLDSLLAAMGERLTDLSIRGFCIPRTAAAKLAGLRRLSVRGPSTLLNFPDIIPVCGGSLTELEIITMMVDEGQVSAITEHCRSLRRLRLHFAGVDTSLAPMWASVGGGLESLEVECFTARCINGHLLDLADFGANCPNVRHLAFTNVHYWSQCEAVQAVCETLGPRLETLVLDRVSIGEGGIARICTACPAVEVDTGFGMTTDCMVALGPRASTIVIGERMQDDDGVLVGLPQLGDVCVNMRKCTLNPVNLQEHCLRALFAKPKPLLRELVVQIMNPVDIAVLFRLLIDKVHTLESFDFEGLCPQISSMRAFIRANGGLKKVKMKCWPDNQNQAEGGETEAMNAFWPPTVAAFLQAPSVESLEFECLFQADCVSHSQGMFVGVADACIRSRNRSVSVCVCERVYL